MYVSGALFETPFLRYTGQNDIKTLRHLDKDYLFI